MATAREVIGTLQSRGVTLEADGASRLRVIGISRLTEQEKATLRQHKASILKALAPTGPTQEPPGTPDPIVPSERECRHCSYFEKYPYEPLGSCHVYKRMQHTTSKPIKFGCSHFQPVPF